MAIELRAMRVATEELTATGWTVEDVSLYRPYDLDCRRDADSKRIEVKGTTGDGSSVLLTPGEVEHARDNPDIVELMIVTRIELERDPDGAASANGGNLEVISPWHVDSGGDLLPTGYQYKRPKPPGAN